MELSRKRWYLLAVSCLINLCAGSIYAWSVFSAPLAAHLSQFGPSVTTGDLALAFGFANSVGPIPMIFGGYVNDRFGPRAVICTGGLLIAAGFFGCILATTVLGVVLSYGLLFGMGLGLTYGCTINNSIKFFPDHRGLVGGLTTAACGISSVIVSPVAAALNGLYGIVTTFIVLGIVFGSVIFVGGLLSQKCPDGFLPRGWQPVVRTAAGSEKDWKAMLSSPIFYPIVLLLSCGAVSGMMVLSQAAGIAQTQMGLSAAAAATAVSVIALSNLLGRILAGLCSDRVGRMPTLSAALVCAVAGMVLLGRASAGNLTVFYTAFILVGVSFGAFMGVFPGLTADEFGTRNNSVNYGIMFCGFALAGVVGPLLMRSLYGITGSFVSSYWVAAGIAGVGLVMVLAYCALKRRV